MAKRNIINNYFILLAGCLLLWLAIPFTVRANDEFNVHDYGAIANDSMDDYNAIQSALNAARGSNGQATVIIPKGTYYLNNNSLRISSNTTLIADGATIIFNGGGGNVPMLVNAEASMAASGSAGGYNHLKHYCPGWYLGRQRKSNRAGQYLPFLTCKQHHHHRCNIKKLLRHPFHRIRRCKGQ